MKSLFFQLTRTSRPILQVTHVSERIKEIKMILKIANDTRSIVKKGMYLFSLVDYPQIQEWEWNNILAFIAYEKSQGDTLEIICEDEEILSLVQDAAKKIDGTEYIPPIEEAIEEFVYHATNVNAAQKIFASGKLLSATKAYGKTGEELVIERNAEGWDDPAHFYEYVMFGWGTHLVGDYVVLSEDFPCAEDLENGNFDAGVRFYIRYEDIIKHKGHVFDGYHPLKVKDEIALADYLYACIVPEQYKKEIEKCIPPELMSKVHYLSQRGLNLQEWNNKVVEYIGKM